MLTVLAQHHTPDARHSYYVLHNAAVTWGCPGEPQLAALHLQRNTEEQTFRFNHAEFALPVMAQSWLTARGCPEGEIHLAPGTGPAPADTATMALERRVRGDGDHFAELTSYTHDMSEAPATAVLLREIDERAAQPFRILLEQVDMDAYTYTLREGVFDTLEAATAWWESWRDGDDVALPTDNPLPVHRTAPPALPTPPAGPAPGSPSRGRSR